MEEEKAGSLFKTNSIKLNLRTASIFSCTAGEKQGNTTAF